MSLPNNFYMIIQACFMVHNTSHLFSYNATYYYACFVECKRYHFILHIAYCHSLLTESCKTLHDYIEAMQ